MKVVIIGGVAAGMSCAAKLRRLMKDTEIKVFEKTDTISYSACGIPYYVGKEFDEHEKLLVRSVQEFKKSEIDVFINHEVKKIDFEKKRVLVHNEIDYEDFYEEYDILLVATGANAIRPKLPGIDLNNIYNVKTVEEGIKIRNKLESMKSEEVVVVGGGYIGMEMTEALFNWKKKITIIEMGESILNSFDSEITEVLQEYLKKKNITIKTEEEVTSFKGEKGVKSVVTDKGEYPCELVVLGIGFAPATGFLKDSPLNMDDRGAIIVDRLMRTNIENVYAAGDCAQVYHKVLKENTYIPLGTNANKQGKKVAEAIWGDESKIPGTLGSTVVKVIDMELGMTGIGEKEAKRRGLNYGTNFIKSYTGPQYYPPSREIYVKIIYNLDNRKIIGGQIIGEKDAGIRADIIAAAIFKDMTVDELGMLDLCYAPPFSNVWDPVSIAGKTVEAKHGKSR